VKGIIGLSIGSKGLVADVVGEWLADQFGQPFVERRTDTEVNLAIETFYDKLDCDFRDHAMIATVGLVRESPSMAPSLGAFAGTSIAPSDSIKFIAEMEPFTFKHQGLAHAFPSRATGRMQVTFDHLPGALEFAGKSTATLPFPSGSETPMRHLEATAWYGLGLVTDEHYKILQKLSTIIRHGDIDSNIKIRLVENV
jgi:hypothetical protein